LGLCPQTPLHPAARGSASRHPYPSSYIVNSSLCICSQITDSFGIKQRHYFLVIRAGRVHQALGVEKNTLHFVCHRLPYGNYNHRFQFFLFCPHPTHFSLAAPLEGAIIKSRPRNNTNGNKPPSPLSVSGNGAHKACTQGSPQVKVLSRASSKK